MMTVANIRCAIIPRGTYEVGTRGQDRFASATERPLFGMSLPKPVAVACDPVTEREYATFAPNHVEKPADLPVVNVSWPDANAYCAWLGAKTGYVWRLPSEAEWETACRAGTNSPYSTGDSLPLESANYLYNESGERVGLSNRTSPGKYPPNAWGLHDMHGNVAEWCADAWHPSLDGAASDGSPRDGSPGSLRVIRGGSWDLLPRLLRSSNRDALPPDTRRDNVGFRVALTLSE
jgi:formylglycine-generating enzyme required for sulfatase activity